MRILGIDPGTRAVGYGLVEARGSAVHPLAVGLIRPAAKDPLPRRLAEIFDRVQEVITRCRPDIAAVEEVFYGRNGATLIKIGEARGVILSAFGKAGVDVVGHSPAAVKKAVAGNGRATKAQVREMVGMLLGKDLEFDSHDVSDALAIALCHAHRCRLKALGL